ncbi:MAG: hypothetical protein QOG43_256 [Actinomycetota bacterium]|jgi:hypothetical protein|nr:hypothetical protein [Actinomycetota bacterium]
MLNLKHGGHALASDAKGATEAAKKMDVVILPAGERPTETPFDYLFPQLAGKPGAHLPGTAADVVAALKALGSAMVDSAPAAATDPKVPVNSTIPAIYTYWGQFIDHDTTANTDRDSVVSDITRPDLKPVPPAQVVKLLKNLRRPNLDLDSLYGNGPALMNKHHNDDGMYDGPRFRLGTNADGPGIPGVKIPPEADLHRDLPRIGPLLDAGVITMDDIPASLKDDPNLRTRAFVGDLRNDENLLVAQFHTAVLRFHNKVVDRLAKKDIGPKVQFRRAQQLTRFHYQWLVVNDYLRTVTAPGVVDKVLTGGPKHYHPVHGELFMPLEYSVAAFRFGHSMVRGGYDHNRNFGSPGNVLPFAAFNQLFLFTGNGFQIDPADPTKSVRNPFLGQPTLPFNWIIEFDRFTNKADPNEGHFARKIDTRIVPPITQMVNEGTGSAIQDDAGKPIRELLRHLGQRNLVRGYLLSIPTGQAVAAELGVVPLSEDELQQGNTPEVNAALAQGGFLEHTPLWYYVLKEAEVRANGNSLGEVGSRIVCETLIGVLRNDPDSYLNQPTGWDPSDGVTLPNGDPITTIRDFLSFTGVPV